MKNPYLARPVKVERERNTLIALRKHHEGEEGRVQRHKAFSELRLQFDVPSAGLDDFSERGVVKCTLPGKRSAANSINMDYDVFTVLEKQNTHRFTPEWNAEQVEFFQTMSEEEIEMLITYSYRGDQMINSYLEYGFPFNTSIPLQKRKASWYVSNGRVLFKSQAMRYIKATDPTLYQHLTSLDKKTFAEELSELLRKWSQVEWNAVLHDYYHRMLELYDRAPRLKEPMILYRGERKYHDGEVSIITPLAWSVGKRFFSCSLDCSAASFFARDYLRPNSFSENGTIYRIIFPVGCPMILTYGCNITSDIEEMEVMSIPLFTLKRIGQQFLVHSPKNPYPMHVQDIEVTLKEEFRRNGSVVDALKIEIKHRPKRRRSFSRRYYSSRIRDK